MRAFALLVLAAAASACSPYSPDLGATPFLCGSAAPQCPDGYTCNTAGGGAGVCTKMGGGAVVDGNPSNCSDDSSLEPNDSISMAWQTPVDTRKSFPLTMLAICPAGDKDTYAMSVSVALENIEVLVDFDTQGAQLSGAILNSTGTAVANAMPITGSPGHIRAYLAMAPVGTYYAQVFAAAGSGPATNNYSLTINITGP